MLHSSLIAFLDGKLPPKQFCDEIAAEVVECVSAIRSTKVGRIAITDGPDTVLTRARTRRLFQAIADKALSLEAANYAADCILMSHTFEFEDELVGEAVHYLADEYPLPTEAEVRNILTRLA